MRGVGYVALAGCLVGLSVAEAAAPAKLCRQIVDASGDARSSTHESITDIASADIAVTSKNLKVEIRLTRPQGGASSPVGRAATYYVDFTAPGSANPQFLRASIPFVPGENIFLTGERAELPTGTQAGFSDAANPQVTGTITNGVVTITAPVAALTRVKLTRGAKLSGLKVTVQADYGAFLLESDSATTTKPYVVGTPTCLSLV